MHHRRNPQVILDSPDFVHSLFDHLFIPTSPTLSLYERIYPHLSHVCEQGEHTYTCN